DMAVWLKQGAAPEVVKNTQIQVRETVENILSDIEARGDAAIRELSFKFDKVERDNFRLSEQEIEACLSQLTKRNLTDIRFAQT
ncbi:histidinol dehydrogenase, partial [Acinetobacter nosocomialis]|uniref:histidinol dehydrogenase n=1 Tax=Acinetobacter nosocomialis TaxID=106654 RepID=UPI0030FCDCAC